MESVIRSHLLFADLTDEEYEQALRFFSAHSVRYRRGDILNVLFEPLRCFGLVLSGTVQVYQTDYDGQPIIMATVHPGGTFGESLCFLQRDNGILIEAESDSEVLWLNPISLRSPCVSDLEQRLSARFIAMIAERSLAQNARIQILSKPTLRAKLITYLSQYAHLYGTEFDIPYTQTQLAVYLGCDRAALCRELSRMQAEGYFRYHRSHFILSPQKSR